MRRQRGVRKIDTFEVDGVTLEVHCEMETGKFRIEVDNKVFEGSNLSDVRTKATTYVSEKKRADFKPVILVQAHGGFDNDEDRLVLRYERFFRANGDNEGKTLWKAWNFEGERKGKDADRTDGKPSYNLINFPGWRSDATFIEYTPERWLALRSISKAMAELNKRLKEAIKPNKCEEFLASIHQRGVERLMAPEKKQ